MYSLNGIDALQTHWSHINRQFCDLIHRNAQPDPGNGSPAPPSDTRPAQTARVDSPDEAGSAASVNPPRTPTATQQEALARIVHPGQRWALLDALARGEEIPAYAWTPLPADLDVLRVLRLVQNAFQRDLVETDETR